MKEEARPIRWADIFNRHLARGEDHASAAYAADRWEERCAREIMKKRATTEARS